MDYAEALNPGFRTGARQDGVHFGIGAVAVWELVVTDELLAQKEFNMFTERAEGAHRQRSQRGVFTSLDHLVHLDIEAFANSIDLGHLIAKYEISGQAMGVALYDCELMNINPATMFPDLDGAAAMANLWNTFETLGMLGSAADAQPE